MTKMIAISQDNGLISSLIKSGNSAVDSAARQEKLSPRDVYRYLAYSGVLARGPMAITYLI